LLLSSYFKLFSEHKNTFSYRIYSLLCRQITTIMLTFVQVLDFIGTFAFAISGIRLASAKQFDWFGAYVVGLATAIGGGTIRDVLLDVTPGWMTDPIYLICTGLALFWVELYLVRKESVSDIDGEPIKTRMP
jgi:hypothetical protein